MQEIYGYFTKNQPKIKKTSQKIKQKSWKLRKKIKPKSKKTPLFITQISKIAKSLGNIRFFVQKNTEQKKMARAMIQSFSKT
jgi:hypothetical protein